MNDNNRKLYLDLLRESVTYALWPEPDISVRTFLYKKKWHVAKLQLLLDKFVSLFGLKLVEKRNPNKGEWLEGRGWPLYAHTMVGRKRLDNLRACVIDVVENNVPGDIIETGVWRGGASIFMKGILSSYNEDRTLWVADSFKGLPAPDSEKYPADEGDTLHLDGFLAIPKETVQGNFEKYGLLDDNVKFLEGYFEDTIETAPITNLALMRLDGDMYSSTIVVLENLYPKLSVGGYCIIDDYAIVACKQAVHDFREKYNITDPIIEIDWTGVYWQKKTEV